MIITYPSPLRLLQFPQIIQDLNYFVKTLIQLLENASHVWQAIT